jgi:hypothetical protein
MKAKVYRFQKDTIKSTDWFINIEEENGKYTMWKGLLRKEDFEIIKQTTKEISKDEALTYIAENKDYLIETYERTL